MVFGHEAAGQDPALGNAILRLCVIVLGKEGALVRCLVKFVYRSKKQQGSIRRAAIARAEKGIDCDDRINDGNQANKRERAHQNAEHWWVVNLLVNRRDAGEQPPQQEAVEGDVKRAFAVDNVQVVIEAPDNKFGVIVMRNVAHL